MTPSECFMCPLPASPLRDRVAGELDPGEAWVVMLEAARAARTLIEVGCETSWHDADERGWRYAIENYRTARLWRR